MTGDQWPRTVRSNYFLGLWPESKLCTSFLFHVKWTNNYHYNDVIIGAIAFQITSLTSVYSTVYSEADHRKHQNSASPAFVRGIHRGPENSPHKWPVTRKMFPFDDVIMLKIWSVEFLAANNTFGLFLQKVHPKVFNRLVPKYTQVRGMTHNPTK